MTRFLSESLQASEPYFRQGLAKLEAANGHPSTDIRFSSEVGHQVRQKISLLGLDATDTTPRELYQALQEQVRRDDRRLTRTLQTLAATHVSAEADVVAGMVHALRELPDSKRCYAIKPASFRAIIKRIPPKKAMKQLGYRSLASFLKHESPAAILAAAHLTEDGRWQQRLYDQYKKLSPADFESRSITIMQADYKRWQDLAESVVAARKHNVLCFKELGAVVLLPLPSTVPDGAVTASLSLALHELNEIRATSTFLKLHQVRADFGDIVRQVAQTEPQLNSQLLDRAVPWHLVQRFYGRSGRHFDETVFEPHVQLEDMAWHEIEDTLAHIEPAFGFWQGGSHLGLAHPHRAVSLNLVDVVLNLCNRLPFEQRLVHYFQRSLWHELMMRYLQPAAVEQTVLRDIQPHLATELALT